MIILRGRSQRAAVAGLALAAGGVVLGTWAERRRQHARLSDASTTTTKTSRHATRQRRRRNPQVNHEREERMHAAAARVVHQSQSDYQDICVVEHGGGSRSDVRLLIDGELQFSSVDEYRYHECLVHPALALASSLASVGSTPDGSTPDGNNGSTPDNVGMRVLLLGAGDGLAAREVLKHPAVVSVDIVDLDTDVTDLCRIGTPHTIPRLVQLCGGAFENDRVTLHTTDAQTFLERHRSSAKDDYDVIIMDLPDPITKELARLYTVEFFSSALSALRRDQGGVLVTHGGDLFANRPAFWSLAETLRAATKKCGFGGGSSGEEEVLVLGGGGSSDGVATYAAPVPSFGVWGFALACTSKNAALLPETSLQQGAGNNGATSSTTERRRRRTLTELMQQQVKLEVACRFLSQRTMVGLFELPLDLQETDNMVATINTEERPILHTMLRKGNLWTPGMYKADEESGTDSSSG